MEFVLGEVWIFKFFGIISVSMIALLLLVVVPTWFYRERKRRRDYFR